MLKADVAANVAAAQTYAEAVSSLKETPLKPSDIVFPRDGLRQGTNPSAPLLDPRVTSAEDTEARADEEEVPSEDMDDNAGIMEGKSLFGGVEKAAGDLYFHQSWYP